MGDHGIPKLHIPCFSIFAQGKYHAHLSTVHLQKLVRLVALWPSSCSVRVKFSYSCWHIMRVRNFRCLLLILSTSVLSDDFFFKGCLLSPSMDVSVSFYRITFTQCFFFVFFSRWTLFLFLTKQISENFCLFSRMPVLLLFGWHFPDIPFCNSSTLKSQIFNSDFGLFLLLKPIMVSAFSHFYYTV